MEPVTRGVNTLRGNSPAAQSARKTHCPFGHPYAGDNLRINGDGSRHCRACDRARKKKYLRKLRETVPAGNPAKLTQEQATEIRQRLADGKRGIGAALAKEYGVSQATISLIKHGKVW
jgi:hypothetical protein